MYIYIYICHLKIYTSQITLVQIANYSSPLPTAATATLATTTSQWEIAWSPMKSVWTRYLYDQKRLQISSVCLIFGRPMASHCARTDIRTFCLWTVGKVIRKVEVLMCGCTLPVKKSHRCKALPLSVSMATFQGMYEWLLLCSICPIFMERFTGLTLVWEVLNRTYSYCQECLIAVVESGSWIDLFGKVKNAPPFCTLVWSWGNLRIWI